MRVQRYNNPIEQTFVFVIREQFNKEREFFFEKPYKETRHLL